MLLIKNGKIIDGSGKPAYKADILISGDKISAIGTIPKKSGIETIDALGRVIAPGFIDPNTDSDHYLTLWSDPGQGDFIRQGVTTIIGGHCGASLAPLLYGSLASIRKWADITQINVGWHSVADFLRVLEEKKLGVNFGTLIGHSTIRRALIGEALRDLTDNELLVFADIVKKSLKEGALGLSTGLGYAHSALVPFTEIKQLAEVVANHGGVYASHLRNDNSKLIEAVREIIEITKISKVRSLISHLRPLTGFENEISETRKMISELDPSIDLHFDIFPFDTSYIPIYTLMPDWAKRGNLETMWESLTRHATREQIKKELSLIMPEKIIIASAPSNKYLTGKTVAEFAKDHGVIREEALVELMVLTRMKAVLIYENINKKIAEEMIFDDHALIGSNGASRSADEYAISPERGLKTFPKFLELASQKPGYSRELAIKKITYSVARKFGVNGRGLIKEGFFADLVMLDAAKAEFVFVNGKMALADGELRDARAGQIIKKS